MDYDAYMDKFERELARDFIEHTMEGITTDLVNGSLYPLYFDEYCADKYHVAYPKGETQDE